VKFAAAIHALFVAGVGDPAAGRAFVAVESKLAVEHAVTQIHFFHFLPKLFFRDTGPLREDFPESLIDEPESTQLPLKLTELALNAGIYVAAAGAAAAVHGRGSEHGRYAPPVYLELKYNRAARFRKAAGSETGIKKPGYNHRRLLSFRAQRSAVAVSKVVFMPPQQPRGYLDPATVAQGDEKGVAQGDGCKPGTANL